ncbi:MAG: hypothetical protein LBH00_03135 [Planctomycetaceae bacterium]|jgi:hypothetical protein|nr:hypothetical protein [Planctomycetaceae bacterium]
MLDVYDQVHLFIDESGNIQDDNDPVKLVGGVLLFGSYGKDVQNKIGKTLKNALVPIQGSYPRDLHFSKLFRDQKNLFRETLYTELKQWKEAAGVEIYGIAVKHEEDVFSDAVPILAEQSYDNRYFLMLGKLFEYSFFVSKRITAKLADDAVIHLYIARRSFYIPPYTKVADDYEKMGYFVFRNKKTHEPKIDIDARGKRWFKVTASIQESDLREMFQSIIDSRWKNNRKTIGTIRYESIDYDASNYRSAKTTQGLYLADIQLAAYRNNVTKKVLKTIELPLYNRKLEAAAEFKSLLDTGDTEALFAHLAQDPIDPQHSELIAVLAGIFCQTREPFYRLFESARQQIGRSDRREQGLELFELLNAVYRQSDTEDLYCDLYSVQIRLSRTTHIGNNFAADHIWNEYLALENRLPELDNAATAMNFKAECRCQRAVNLMDQFRYQEAEFVLSEICEGGLFFRNSSAEFSEEWVNALHPERLGKCYSTVGQLLAFQGDRSHAEMWFRKALTCFSSDEDRERIWVYLGHLAADAPEECQTLFDETVTYLNELSGEVVHPFEKPFVLALKLKGLYCFGNRFGNTATKKQWIEDLTAMAEDCSPESFQSHPWGMIFQMAALISADIWRETNDDYFADYADMFFDMAAESFSCGKTLLKFLGEVCLLRKEMFLSERSPEKARVERQVKKIQSQAAEMNLLFTDIKKKDVILSMIRFNNW